MKKRKLTAKQQKFIDNYIQSGNGSEAAIQAGYAPKSARVTATRLLTKDNICKIIDERQSKAANEADISLKWVLEQVKDLAENSKTDNNKLKALDMLMKHTGG